MHDTIITQDIDLAASFIRRGEVVAFPTETVYGLGGDAWNETALHKIFTAKGRPSDNPLILHVADRVQVVALVREMPPDAEKLVDAFWPGPLTVVLPKSARVPLLATAGLDTVGIRAPAHPTAQTFLRACGVPVAAPSANLSGRPSPTTWQAVAQDLNGRIACLLQGGPTQVGLESTVVDCTGPVPVVLRAGAVTLEQLRAVIPATAMLVPDSHAPAKSPGLKHRHYAPQARVVLVSAPPLVADQTAAYIGLATTEAVFAEQKVCPDTTAYAHELFAFFRACEARGVTVIYCQTVDENGLGVALMDRLRRAAAR